MPASLEKSAVAIGLEKVSFDSNPKERQCQRMFKLLYNCTHLSSVQFSPVQLLSHVWLFVIPWTTSRQASLSITNSWSISHACKVMLKILQARLQQYVNQEFPDVQAGFRKGRGTRNQTANIHWIIKTVREFQEKHLFLLYWLCQSLWLCGSQ